MLQSMRRRWAFVTFVVLGALALGAVWAALATARYQSRIELEELGQPLIDEQYLQSELRAAAADTGIAIASPAVTTTFERDGSRITFTAQADSAEHAAGVAELYGNLVVERSGSVRVLEAAEYPTSPYTPNLRRIALISALAGLAASAVASAGLDRARRQQQPAAPLTEPDAPTTGPPVVAPARVVDLARVQQPQPAPPMHSASAMSRSAALQHAPRIVDHDPSRSRTRRPAATPRVVSLPSHDPASPASTDDESADD